MEEAKFQIKISLSKTICIQVPIRKEMDAATECLATECPCDRVPSDRVPSDRVPSDRVSSDRVPKETQCPMVIECLVTQNQFKSNLKMVASYCRPSGGA